MKDVLVLVAFLLFILFTVWIDKAYPRPGDGLTCVRDYTGTCVEPEPPKDPCGRKRDER